MEPNDNPRDAGFDLDIVLQQIRDAVASGDGLVAGMTDGSVARAEERRRAASAAAGKAGATAADRAAAATERTAAADEIKQAKSLGEVHRQVLTLLGEDALRLVRGLPTAMAWSDEPTMGEGTARTAPGGASAAKEGAASAPAGGGVKAAKPRANSNG